VLVTVVILSALVPTLTAQQWFEPELENVELEETMGEEDLTNMRHRHCQAQSMTEATTEATASGRPGPGAQDWLA
jgi:hypothetical protein